jgi:hypothetical protein
MPSRVLIQADVSSLDFLRRNRKTVDHYDVPACITATWEAKKYELPGIRRRIWIPIMCHDTARIRVKYIFDAPTRSIARDCGMQRASGFLGRTPGTGYGRWCLNMKQNLVSRFTPSE